MSKDKLGRIWFPGNPWPDGHGLKELVWSGRIDEEGDLYFHLHLVTIDYRNEYDSDEDPEESDNSWESPIVWRNYHATSMSSTMWGDDGFKVASPGDPISLAYLGNREIHVDPLPECAETDLDELAFHIYCLGHDAVADHRIRFTPCRDGRFELDWKGMHANAYVGDYDYIHPFHAKGVVNRPIIVAPRGSDWREARRMLKEVLVEAGDYRATRTSEDVRLIPKKKK